MPQNNHWRNEIDNFHYKVQDFVNSCFPACLQMALENFDIIHGIEIGAQGRPIEEIFNGFCLQGYAINIDEEAPTIEMVNDFMFHTFYQGRNQINVMHIEHIGGQEFENIRELINNNIDIAVIGAINVGGGHATMIIKKDNVLYAVNPQPFNQACAQIEIENVVAAVPLNDPNNPVEGIMCNGPGEEVGVIMNYCYIITRV